MTITTRIVSTSFPWLTLAICAVYHGNQNDGGDITSEVIWGLLTTVCLKLFNIDIWPYSVVEVDLASSYFAPGKKQYERVRWCLKDNQLLTFKFLMSWTCKG